MSLGSFGKAKNVNIKGEINLKQSFINVTGLNTDSCTDLCASAKKKKNPPACFKVGVWMGAVDVGFKC